MALPVFVAARALRPLLALVLLLVGLVLVSIGTGLAEQVFRDMARAMSPF